jgi:hypothetical protein
MNGFALSPVLRAELENVDLLASPAAPCEQACILSRNDALAHSLARRLEFLKCSVRLVDLPDDVAGLRIVRIVVGALQTM